MFATICGVKTIALDFDGVIHAYSRGWEDGTIYDVPVHGALEAVKRIAAEYRIEVFTARDEEQLADWLEEHGFEPYVALVTNRKPKASVYIDDRALRFDGDWLATLVGLRALMERDDWRRLDATHLPREEVLPREETWQDPQL